MYKLQNCTKYFASPSFSNTVLHPVLLARRACMSKAYPVRRGKHAILKPLDSCAEARAGRNSFTPAIGDKCFAHISAIWQMFKNVCAL